MFILFLSKTVDRKVVDFSGIRTHIVRVEGEQADHLTTTTASTLKNIYDIGSKFWSRYLRTTKSLSRYLIWLVSVRTSKSIFSVWAATIAQWIRLRLPFAAPGSNPKHTSYTLKQNLFNFVHSNLFHSFSIEMFLFGGLRPVHFVRSDLFPGLKWTFHLKLTLLPCLSLSLRAQDHFSLKHLMSW